MTEADLLGQDRGHYKLFFKFDWFKNVFETELDSCDWTNNILVAEGYVVYVCMIHLAEFIFLSDSARC